MSSQIGRTPAQNLRRSRIRGSAVAGRRLAVLPEAEGANTGSAHVLSGSHLDTMTIGRPLDHVSPGFRRSAEGRATFAWGNPELVGTQSLAEVILCRFDLMPAERAILTEGMIAAIGDSRTLAGSWTLDLERLALGIADALDASDQADEISEKHHAATHVMTAVAETLLEVHIETPQHMPTSA